MARSYVKFVPHTHLTTDDEKLELLSDAVYEEPVPISLAYALS